MTYKIAVCDDEKIFIDDVVAKLKEQSEDCEIVAFLSGEELLNSTLDFNIIFLDIEMTGIDGINTAFSLREKGYDGIIIFLTSHTEFMPDAFKVKAFRFLDKPLELDKFNEAFSNAKNEILNTEHILIFDKGKTVFVKLTDIVYLEAYGDGTYIFDKSGMVYLVLASRLVDRGCCGICAHISRGKTTRVVHDPFLRRRRTAGAVRAARNLGNLRAPNTQKKQRARGES